MVMFVFNYLLDIIKNGVTSERMQIFKYARVHIPDIPAIFWLPFCVVMDCLSLITRMPPGENRADDQLPAHMSSAPNKDNQVRVLPKVKMNFCEGSRVISCHISLHTVCQSDQSELHLLFLLFSQFYNPAN